MRVSAPLTPSASPPVSVAMPSRGWFRLMLALIVALSVPVVAQLRVFVPVEQTVLFLGPTMAVCAMLAWWLGGGLWMFVAWLGLAAWMLLLQSPVTGVFDPLSRGWVLLLTASFGVVSWVRPRRGFFHRALSATAMSFMLALSLIGLSSARMDDVARTVSAEFSRRLQVVTDEFELRSRSPEWREIAERFPSAAAVVEEGEKQLAVVARTSITLFPALLALQSLAMLALGWAVFHRASRTRVGPLLSPLSEFRFSDQLVWGLVLGITVLVLPGLSELRGAGLNLLVFFGALYALRGLGVLSWFIAPGRPTPALLIVAAVLAGPIVGFFTLGLGLADTWIDWRGRVRPAA